MTKQYCDNCETEITKQKPCCVSEKIVFYLGELKFQVILATDDVWNNGCLCLKCTKMLFLKAINKKIKELERK